MLVKVHIIDDVLTCRAWKHDPVAKIKINAVIHRNALELPWSTLTFVAVGYKVHKHGLRTGSARVVHDHTISVVGVANLVTRMRMCGDNLTLAMR